jgi:4'-phosphopantetheinyl transferase
VKAAECAQSAESARGTQPPEAPKAEPLEPSSAELPPEPARPELDDGALHVWAVDLDALGARRAHLLCEQERARAQRIVREPARTRWLAARSFVRALLSSYTGIDAGALQLRVSPDGKPELAREQSVGLSFSISHSGPAAVCALTRMCAVGVDVQIRPRPGALEAVAERAFGQARAQLLRALPSQERECELLRAWVRLEAERKRTGTGLLRARERQSGPQPWCAELRLAVPKARLAVSRAEAQSTALQAAGAVALARPPASVHFATFSGSFPIIGSSMLPRI